MAIVVSVCCDKLYHTVETGNYTLDAAAVIDPKAKYRSKIVIFAPYTIQYNINKFVTRSTCQFASESGAAAMGDPSKYCYAVWYGKKTRMLWLPDG